MMQAMRGAAQSRYRVSEDCDAQLRPIRPDDAPGLIALFNRLSDETIRYRWCRESITLGPASGRQAWAPRAPGWWPERPAWVRAPVWYQPAQTRPRAAVSE